MKRFHHNRHREPNSDQFDAWTTVNGPFLAEIRSPEGAARECHPQKYERRLTIASKNVLGLPTKDAGWLQSGSEEKRISLLVPYATSCRARRASQACARASQAARSTRAQLAAAQLRLPEATYGPRAIDGVERSRPFYEVPKTHFH